jgi:hypothetical protein
MPVPQADPKALEWMTAEQNTPRPKETVVHKGMGMMHNSPDVHTAAAHGVPNLEPESDEGGGDILKGGNRSNLGMSTGAGTGSGTGSGTGAVVDVVKPGDPAPAGSTTEDVNSNASGDAASGTTPAAGADANAGNANTPAADASGSGSTQDSSASGDSTKPADNTQPASGNGSQSSKESSSKKKGIKKILPW